MKNKKLFEKTVSILVKAYQNGTLEHGSCVACAVGNIIAHNMGLNVDIDGNIWVDDMGMRVVNKWDDVFYTSCGEQEITLIRFLGDAKEQIKSSGYSLSDLAKIEFAFETCKIAKTTENYMFNGLMSVIDTLMIIHGADQKTTNKAKSRFVKETV